MIYNKSHAISHAFFMAALRIFVVLLLALVYVTFGELKVASDGSVCANMCSGHGECIDYSCHCYLGYHGDSCSITFGDENNLVPILTAGHFNVTRKNFTSTINKYASVGILIGFSSYKCFKCIRAEPDYKLIAARLNTMQIPFGRADVDNMKAIAKENAITELPSLVYFRKNVAIRYNGYTSESAVINFIKKLTGPPIVKLDSLESVHKFIESRKEEMYSPATLIVIGFFSDYTGIEEDDYDDFVQTAKDLQSKEDIYFGVVIKSSIVDHYKKSLKLIDRTPSVYVIGETGIPHTINIDEFSDTKIGLNEWIIAQSIPIVGKLTPYNFQLYEKINKPMILLFLNLTEDNEKQITSNGGDIAVAGKSGGILNELLMIEFKLAAIDMGDKMNFVYLDGMIYEDKMRALGLYGGAERLPSIAVNARGGIQAPFPEEYGINKQTIVQFCADFLTGKIKSANDAKELAKRALQSATPISQKNKAIRQKRKEYSKDAKRGVSEQFGDGAEGDDAIAVVTLKNFEEICLDEDKDVVLLLYAKECESCFHFAVYFKRMAARFKNLTSPSLVIARMDITNQSPPAHLNLLQGNLPELVMLPAGAKYAPWAYYSGVGKVQEMMYWVRDQAAIPFELPNLPHLTEANRKLYKEQIREREIGREKQREEEAEAMLKEDEARRQYELKRNAINSESDSTTDGEF